MIHRVGFDIEVGDGIELSLTQFIDDLRTVLPKEWWHGDADEDYAWLLTCIYPLNDDGTLRQAAVSLRPRSYQMIRAELDQERKLTQHQADRIDLLEKANGNQFDTIKGQKRGIKALSEEIELIVTSDHAQVLALEEVIAGLRDELTETDKRLSSSLHEYTVVKQQRDDAAANVMYVQDEKDQFITDNRSLKAELLKANTESQVHANMIHKIVDAMEGAGYDISGWGNDAQLEELETASTQVDDYLNAAKKQMRTLRDAADEVESSLDDTTSEVDGLDSLLDNIRTQR